MKIKLLTSRVNARGQAETRGDKIEADDHEAERLIAAGQAVAVPTENKGSGPNKPTKR